MKKIIFTLWTVSVALVVSVAFGANKQKRRNSKAKAQQTRQMEPVNELANDNDFFPTLFGRDQTEEQSRENFWKLFGAGVSDNFNKPTKQITHQDALAIVNAMNNVSDIFNQDHSFTKLDRSQFMISLTMFLENPKNQPVLKNFLHVLKDKAVDVPWLSICAVNIEQAINNKDAEQFWLIYSDLEGYFRELPIETRSLIRVTTGWRATLKNIKDAVANRARRAYSYLFSRKSAAQGPRMVMKSVISYDDPVTGKRVTKNITEIQDATGKVSTQEGL